VWGAIQFYVPVTFSSVNSVTASLSLSKNCLFLWLREPFLLSLQIFFLVVI
jgi:hypothetical protein